MLFRSITEDSWAIQIGAFRQRSLAERFRKQLETNLGKKVEITVSGDYYRVRILELPTRAEVDENVIKLNKLGFKELWIIRLLAKEQQRILVAKDDSLATVRETIAERPEIFFTPDMAIQVGAFRQESNALALKQRLSAVLNKQIVISPQDGWFKVRVTGFSSLEEMEKFIPTLSLLGVRDIWILPLTEPVEQPAKVDRPAVGQPTAVEPVKVPVLTQEKEEKLAVDEKPVEIGRAHV